MPKLNKIAAGACVASALAWLATAYFLNPNRNNDSNPDTRRPAAVASRNWSIEDAIQEATNDDGETLRYLTVRPAGDSVTTNIYFTGGEGRRGNHYTQTSFDAANNFIRGFNNLERQYRIDEIVGKFNDYQLAQLVDQADTNRDGNNEQLQRLLSRFDMHQIDGQAHVIIDPDEADAFFREVMTGDGYELDISAAQEHAHRDQRREDFEQAYQDTTRSVNDHHRVLQTARDNMQHSQRQFNPTRQERRWPSRPQQPSRRYNGNR